MTFSSQRFDELCKLFAALQDGELDDAAVQSIERLILEDRDVRRLYVSYMGICAGLQWNFGAHGNRTPPQSVEQPAEIAPAAPAVKSPVLGFLGGAIDYVNHSRRLMFLLVAGTLCGWFVFQIGSVLIGRWWAGNAQVVEREGNRPGGPGAKPVVGGLANGTGQSHGSAAAWLSGSVGGRWQLVATNPAAGNQAGPAYWEIGTEFTAGKQVNLAAGLGEITFRSGAKMVVSAPAQFAVMSALGTDLQLGKLSARVPHDPAHDATGFTVNTPAGSVVDLGTEFGVEVTPDHKLDVQVFVGEVKVSAAVDDSGENAGPQIHVGAGKSVHVEPGKPATVVESKDKDRFQRDLTIVSDSSDKQMAAYLDCVRQLKPVVWLRMEGKEGERTIHDEMGGAPDGKLVWDGPGNPFVNGRIGKALWLRGPQLKDYAIFHDYPQAEHGKLSVSAWVYADSRPGFATVAANWGGVKGQFHLGLMQNGRREGTDLCLTILDRDGTKIRVREGETHLFPMNEWQHVAFTSDGETLRLYREGREVAALKHAGPLYPVASKALTVGVSTDAADLAPDKTYPNFWDGRLDEITVFNDALTAEDIKKLAAAPPR